MKLTKSVLMDVEQERINQIGKWGKQEHSLADWYLILAEEVGEVAKAIQEHDGSYGDIYDELIQVAAVAVQICEAIKEAEKDATVT